MESSRNLPDFKKEQKLHILGKLNEAIGFESYLHSKFLGHKRFAISGGESIIPGLDTIIEYGAEQGAREFVIGMPHRGRLNVLVNIMGKPYNEIFSEFEGKDYSSDFFIGDVKYHLGYRNRINTRSGKTVDLNLMPNPSHLEAVDPYTQGVARSRIDHKYSGDVNKLIPIIIHGDAAIAGQGIVYEVLQMSQLKGFHTGGTIHIVINNQIGFTTDYLDGRSSTYCTDVAKVTLCPVFHVNADDVEAVVLAIRLAVEYRQKFHTDVFIDLLGYRKYGHNESDEPKFTQPKLYKLIENHPDARRIYIEKLVEEKTIEMSHGKELEKAFKSRLKQIHSRIDIESIDQGEKIVRDNYLGKKHKYDFESAPETALTQSRIRKLGEKTYTIPGNIKVIAKTKKLYDQRKLKLLQSNTIDWPMAEAIAFASLLDEGTNIRFSGQDSQRGTFSQRHSILKTEDTEQAYVPLNHLSRNQGKLEIYNSLLSEYGVLGFEFGYASASLDMLTIWEAQFGDFSNGAQITIDEFIASSETKWGDMNGLIMLLPHGFEGQGPDHSSARLERFLQLCANENMIIANCSTPANFFHMIRRHAMMPYKSPLVVFTHKSLLRHPRCISDIESLAKDRFQTVLDDPSIGNNQDKTERILLCSGKVYYELDAYRAENKIRNTALIRIEQLYPFPQKTLDQILKNYPSAKEIFWVQEEPENMGAWPYIFQKLHQIDPGHISRKENASPATGFYAVHQKEQRLLVEMAFGERRDQTKIRCIKCNGINQLDKKVKI